MLTITPNFAQERALNMLRRDWKQYNSFMVYSPTGSGKTGLASFITDGHVSRGMRVMFVVPYTTLITQTSDRFIQYGLPEDEIGYIWRDHPNYDPERMIQIASADTLIRRDFPDNIDLLIIDEAHLRRKKLLEVIKHLTEKTQVKVIGLSGTPFSSFLGQYYQRLIKPTTIKELISRGDLSTCEFFAPSMPDLKGVKSNQSNEYGSDYNEEQLAEIMSGADLVGDIVRNWLEHGQDRPTICFCVNVRHANYVTIEFNRAGIAAEVMTAGTPHDERQLIIHRFEQGATKIIVNVGVLVAGFDSDVRAVIYARPTKSEIRWLQTIGRGLRTAPDKDTCLIFDHSGSVHRLGFPDAIEYDELPNKSDGMKDSRAQERTEKIEKLPKECSQCHYMKPAGVYVCPKCGHKPLAGEDVDVDTSRGLKKFSKQERKYTKEDKQRWWSQIKYYQRQRLSQGKPVSDGWCAHTYKSKFGTWPNGLQDYPQEIGPEVSNFIKSKLIAYAKVQEKQQKQQGKNEHQMSLSGISTILETRDTLRQIRSAGGLQQ
ncbi:DEAD/DEAH box helicase family protein [Budviciaceae bacterium CWB-B4]|uniref:DEAD/DEAH box helicase family protein n=1 Tax=Limnobaculum xujianqingii TaxID=2738837 RepID=A0A9D7FRG6_9GAMM|nr:DEAD/DEAH box helicase [Limnobaculum xujianqingii]MBK5072209.1 DEAD/DEAH box helicase family protein [Limnobaculum xujianqingii]MBK5175518.1 DEAD/DEAH box helicase family protein [Limnobaculum xujianqingii]